MPFHLAAFLESGTESSPHEDYEAMLTRALPGSPINEIKPARTLIAANFPFVPGVLAAKILTVEGQAAEVPDTFLQQITFEMRDGNGIELLTHSISASALSQKILEGEAIVEVFGGEPLTAVGLLTRAAREGQAILRLDSGNVGTVLGQVALGDEAEAAVRAVLLCIQIPRCHACQACTQDLSRRAERAYSFIRFRSISDPERR